MPIDVGGYQLSSEMESFFNIVTDGLVLYLDAGKTSSYPGTGTTWFDISGYNKNFTLLNGTAFSSGPPKSFSFDGVNDYTRAVISRTNTFSTKTLEAVYRCVGTEPADQSIFAIMGGASASNNAQTEFILNPAGTTLSVRTITNTIPTFPQIDYSVSLNTIYHITYVEDFGTSSVSLYINGEFIDSAAMAGSTYEYSSTYTHIGVQKPGFSRYLRGNVYLAREYNRALTSSEVLQNFSITKNRFGL